MYRVEEGNPQDVEEGTSGPKGRIEECSETPATTDSTLFANKKPKRVQFRDVLREEDSDPLRPKGKQVGNSLRPRLTSNCILVIEEEPVFSDALESRDFRALRLTHRNAQTGAANGISSKLRDNEFIAFIVHAPRKKIDVHEDRYHAHLRTLAAWTRMAHENQIPVLWIGPVGKFWQEEPVMNIHEELTLFHAHYRLCRYDLSCKQLEQKQKSASGIYALSN